MTMKPTPMLFALLCFAVCLPAAESEVLLKFASLALSDGRVLKKVVVRSYDASADKFLLLADGKAMLVAAGVVPQPACDKLKAGAPKGGSTTSSTPQRAVPAGEAAQRKPADQVPMNPAPSFNPVPDEAVMLDQHREAALTRARNYYRYEFQAGSNAIRVTAMNFEADQPEALTGWPGRYRTEGRVLLEYFDSKGYSFNRATDKFEITTEQKPHEGLKVIDFTRK